MESSRNDDFLSVDLLNLLDWFYCSDKCTAFIVYGTFDFIENCCASFRWGTEENYWMRGSLKPRNDKDELVERYECNRCRIIDCLFQ